MGVENLNVEDYKYIDLVNENGEKERVEILLVFEIKEFNKEYFIYTKNERDEDDNVLLYSSGIAEKDGAFHTAKIETDEEWEVIKGLIKQIVRQEGD